MMRQPIKNLGDMSLKYPLKYFSTSVQKYQISKQGKYDSIQDILDFGHHPLPEWTVPVSVTGGGW